MQFFDSLSMFHVDGRQITCVTGNGVPGERTEGAPGVLYMDLETGDLFKCRAADPVHKQYTWEQLGGAVIDQESIVQQVIAALGTPVFGTVDEENNIVLTGNLTDGSYTLKYEGTDGVLTEIGTVTIGGTAYTNLIAQAEELDSSELYNGTGYKNGYYASSASPYEGADDACVLPGLVPYDGAYGATELPSIYVKGATIDTSNSHVRFQVWKDDKTYINGVSLTEYVTIEMLADSYYKLTFASTIRDTYGAFGFIRMSLVGTGDNLIVTVGEPIE